MSYGKFVRPENNGSPETDMEDVEAVANAALALADEFRPNPLYRQTVQKHSSKISFINHNEKHT